MVKKKVSKKREIVNLIVQSNIKEVVPDMCIASDLGGVLNLKVSMMLLDAKMRAKGNGRTTIMVRDL